MLRFVVLVALILVSCDATRSRRKRLSPPIGPQPVYPPGCEPIFPEECEQSPLDISLVVDASSSIGPLNFDRCLNFLEDLVSYFTINNDTVRFSMVTFAEIADEVNAFGFTNYTNKIDLKLAIARTNYTRALYTNTSAGLWYMLANHTGDRRDYARHIVIVITDGRSQATSKTKAAAADVNALNNTDVFAIGVGPDVYYPELTTIAGGDGRHVFKADSYETLNTLTERLIFQTCDVPTFPVCEMDPVELAFVIDSSASIGDDNFTASMEFVKSVVDHFKIDQEHVRIAAVTFDVVENKDDAIQFDDYADGQSALLKLGAITYHAGSYTNTGAGIHYMRTTLMAKARPNVARICVVITDGNSQQTQATKNQAQDAQENGIIMYAVGVGSGVSQSELNNIAGSEDRTFPVDDYTQLNAFKEQLVNVTCNEILSHTGSHGAAQAAWYTTTPSS